VNGAGNHPTLVDPEPASLAAGVARVRWSRPTEDVVRELAAGGWSVRVVDLAWAPDKRRVLDAFREALAFPSWVGRGWDAFEDAMRDLSWWEPSTRGRALVVRGAERPTTAVQRDRAVLLEVLGSTASWWAERDEPLAVLLRR
jgi:hypothetical protein